MKKLLSRPAAVVAGWGALNGVLALMLAGFGGTALEFPVYLAAAALVIVNAGAVWLVLCRRTRPVWRDPPPGDSVLILALGVVLGALGWAFSWYLMPPAAVLFVLAFLRERKARSQRGPA